MADESSTATAELCPRRLVFSAGKRIVEQGTPASQAFYIEEGTAEVTIKEGFHTVKLGEIGPGEIFGEMGVLGNQARMGTVTALTPCTVTIISREELEARLKKIDDKIIKSLINVLIDRLREANKGQMRYYRHMAVLQNRIAGLMEKAGESIDLDRREAFTAAVLPLLDQLDKLLDEYRGKP